MTTLHFQTTVSADGSIPVVLPEEFRGASVAVKVQTEQTGSSEPLPMTRFEGKPLPNIPLSDYVKSITGLLKGYNEDIDDLLYQSIMEKHSQHCHAQPAD